MESAQSIRPKSVTEIMRLKNLRMINETSIE